MPYEVALVLAALITALVCEIVNRKAGFIDLKALGFHVITSAVAAALLLYLTDRVTILGIIAAGLIIYAVSNLLLQLFVAAWRRGVGV